MFFERKTKKQNIIKSIWFPFLSIAVFLAAFALGGPAPAFYSLGAIYILAAIFPIAIVIKTQNTGFLAVALFQIFAALVCISAPAAIQDKPDAGLIPVFLVAMYVMMLITGYQVFNRKLRWRGEEIFELAAMHVDEIGGSFTARPRPAGKIPVSKTEMIRFVDFVSRNLIAFPFKEENRVVFVLALPGNDLPYIFGLNQNYQQDTWVAVDYDGNITVNITEEDYLLFKMDLDFDQICQSLGDVFSELLSLSKEGQENKIIDRLNALRLNPLG